MVTRVALNDFAGHAFMLSLAEGLSRAGLDVEYEYCDTNLSPHGAFEDASVAVQAISTRQPFEKYRVSRRVISELDYGFGSASALRKFKSDLVILNNVPLISLAAPLALARIRKVHRIIWLQDVQSGLVAGVDGEKGLAARVAARVERFLLQRADTVIAISDELAETARQFGVDPNRIQVIENWAAIESMPPTQRDNEWSQKVGLTERPRFLYSGTLAKKHSPELLVALAESAPEADVIVVSAGVGADWLAETATERHLPNLRVLPFQPFEDLPQVLGAADVLVGLLTHDAAGHSVPSKVLSYLCAGRPILAAIPEDNAAAKMIRDRAGAGITVDPRDEAAFINAAKFLLDDPEGRAAMGKSGRRFAEATFSSDRVARQVIGIVERATKT